MVLLLGREKTALAKKRMGLQRPENVCMEEGTTPSSDDRVVTDIGGGTVGKPKEDSSPLDGTGVT